jgi:hypothetical protein
MPEREESLQQLIDRLPDLVEHFCNDAPAPHFSRAGATTWGEPDGGSRKPQVERHEQTTILATVSSAPFTPAFRDRFREPVGVSP